MEQAPHEPNNNSVEITHPQYKTAVIETDPTSNRNLSYVIIGNGIIEIPPQNLISISILWVDLSEKKSF